MYWLSDTEYNSIKAEAVNWHNMDVHYQVCVKNTDFICLGHLASNARSLQENLGLAAN